MHTTNQVRPVDHVLTFSATSSLYGASRAAVLGAVGLKHLECESTFVIGDGPLWSLIRHEGLNAIEIPNKYWVHSEGGWLKGRRRFAMNRSTVLKNLAQLKLLGVNLVHSHSLVSPLGAMMAKELALPHVWHVHELLSTSQGNRFLLGLRHARKFIDSMTDLLVVNSEFTMSRVTSYCPPSKLRLVYYGMVDENDRRASAPTRAPFSLGGPLRILLVGSLQPRKGQEDAILALAELTSRGIDAHLTFVGEGTSAHIATLKRLAEDAGVASRISWAGFHEDTKPFYDEADVAIVCSREEPLGMVTSESMIAGIPTVGARSGGVMEVIRDGSNGLMYEVGDSRQLADKIEYMAANCEHRSRMVEEGYRNAFEQFGQQRYAREIMSVYEEATETYPSRARFQ